MTEPKRTKSEILFERYLASQGLTDWDFEMEHADRSKHPDYTVSIDSQRLLFEIKEFEDRIPESEVGSYDPYNAIRGKIEEGRRKFKEYKDWPCSIVLYNGGSAPLVDLEDAQIGRAHV